MRQTGIACRCDSSAHNAASTALRAAGRQYVEQSLSRDARFDRWSDALDLRGDGFRRFTEVKDPGGFAVAGVVPSSTVTLTRRAASMTGR